MIHLSMLTNVTETHPEPSCGQRPACGRHRATRHSGGVFLNVCPCGIELMDVTRWLYLKIFHIDSLFLAIMSTLGNAIIAFSMSFDLYLRFAFAACTQL